MLAPDENWHSEWNNLTGTASEQHLLTRTWGCSTSGLSPEAHRGGEKCCVKSRVSMCNSAVDQSIRSCTWKSIALLKRATLWEKRRSQRWVEPRYYAWWKTSVIRWKKDNTKVDNRPNTCQLNWMTIYSQLHESSTRQSLHLFALSLCWCRPSS